MEQYRVVLGTRQRVCIFYSCTACIRWTSVNQAETQIFYYPLIRCKCGRVSSCLRISTYAYKKKLTHVCRYKVGRTGNTRKYDQCNLQQNVLQIHIENVLTIWEQCDGSIFQTHFLYFRAVLSIS